MSIKIFSISLGCPKNRVDTEKLLGAFASSAVVDDINSAHVVVINTCSFITSATRESIQTVLDAASELGDIPASQRPLLAVAGCMPGRYTAAVLAEEMPEVDLWLTLEEMEKWPFQVTAAINEKFPHLKASCGLAGRFLSTPSSYAYLKISEGCEHNCSFCTIPSIRGGLRSFDRNSIVNEGKILVSSGVKELILVAQDLTAYGRDRQEKDALPRLLEELVQLDGLARLRLMYLYPAGITRPLLDFLHSLGSPLVPYFDIPLQHAHFDILKQMGRPFAGNPAKTLDLVREVFPEAAIRTSLIVGFPGETEEHFNHLLDFVEENRFSSLGVFAYEREEGTLAADFPDQVEESTKEKRLDALMQAQQVISEELLEKHLGEKMEIVVDEPQGEWPGLFVGRAWFQAPEVDGVTYISGSTVASGQVLEAEIVETHEYDLTALA